jgi:hypothetical protein
MLVSSCWRGPGRVPLENEPPARVLACRLTCAFVPAMGNERSSNQLASLPGSSLEPVKITVKGAACGAVTA